VRIGAHVPTRGRGLLGAVEAARACGAEAVQVWGSNPRGWAPPRVPEAAAREFAGRWREAGIGPLFFHAPYVVNVASPSAEFRRRSVELARATVALAEAVGAEGVVVHAGAAGARTDRRGALELAASSLLAAAEAADRVLLLVELTAGGTGSVASTLREARELLDAVDRHPRVALCLDTCHLFAAGYPLDDPYGVARTFAELRSLGLARRVRLVHANDSRFPRGQRRDRHAHIGEGHIGEAGFRAVLADPAVRRCPVVVETPGSLEDHARNIAVLRRLAGAGA
jgi:deoxyribonuclease-4